MQVSFKTIESKDKTVDFTVEESFDSAGRPYKTISTEQMSIRLFPVNIAEDASKGASLVANAHVYLKDADISFRMSIRKLKDGSLIAGSNATNRSHRAVVTHYDATRGESYERLTINNNLYREIMALIEANL